MLKLRSPQRHGSIVVLSAFLLIVMLIICACAIDIGFVSLKRTEAQAAADSAALAGLDVLPDGPERVERVAHEMLAANGFDRETTAGIDATIEIGRWDNDLRVFTTALGRRGANAVRVDFGQTTVPSFFGRVMGVGDYSVNAAAIATRRQRPRDIVLVIDCSGSMAATMSNGSTRIENAKNAALALIDELSSEDRVGLAVYSWIDLQRNAYQMTGRAERLLNFTKAPTAARVRQLRHRLYASYTNIGGGFRAGLDVFESSSTRPDQDETERIMVMLTDGRVNRAEPYPTPDDGPDAILPLPPYSTTYDPRPAVTHWADTIKARDIKIHVITLGDSAFDQLMVNAASPPDEDFQYYHHVADGSEDYERLLQVYREIGQGYRRARLAQ